MTQPQLHIRENVADAVFHAYLGMELVAALHCTRMDSRFCIDMVYVKPQYRRRGIAAALVRHLTERHPGATVTYSR